MSNHRGTDTYTNVDSASVPGLNLMQYVGGSKMLTAGFGMFGVKTMIVSNIGATVFGLGSYMMLGDVMGPALALVAGAALGFMGGCVHRWRTDVGQALIVHGMYPDLLRIHLIMVDPSMFLHMDYKEWCRDLRWNMRKQGYMIAAMYSAGEALDKIFQEKNEKVTQQYIDDVDSIIPQN